MESQSDNNNINLDQDDSSNSDIETETSTTTTIPTSLCFLIINFSKQIVSHIQIESFCSKIC